MDCSKTKQKNVNTYFKNQADKTPQRTIKLNKCVQWAFLGGLYYYLLYRVFVQSELNNDVM